MKFVYKYIKMMKIQQEVLTYCVLVKQEHLSNRGISAAQQIELCTRQGVSEENRFLKIKIKSKDFSKDIKPSSITRNRFRCSKASSPVEKVCLLQKTFIWAGSR